MMKKITTRIWKFPDQLFYDEIVNIWFFNDDDKIIIIDGPQSSYENLQFVKSFTKPAIIFLTHSPCIGDSEEFLKRCDVELVIHSAAKSQNLNFEPTRYVDEGEKLSKHITVIHTPGHKQEHACLYSNLENGSMFTGDSLQGDSKANFIDPWEAGTDSNTEQNINSLRKLTKYNFERILPFHYFPILTSASERLKLILKGRGKN